MTGRVNLALLRRVLDDLEGCNQADWRMSNGELNRREGVCNAVAHLREVLDPEPGTPLGDGGLPTFERLAGEAYGLLGDAQDWLHSGWDHSRRISREQGTACLEALRHISAARDALNRAVNW